MGPYLGGPGVAALAGRLAEPAWALAGLSEEDPELAGDLALEAASLEARILVGTGCIERGVAGGAAEADVARLGRLETLVAQARIRTASRMGALEAEAKRRPLETLGAAVSIGSALWSAAKHVF